VFHHERQLALQALAAGNCRQLPAVRSAIKYAEIPVQQQSHCDQVCRPADHFSSMRPYFQTITATSQVRINSATIE
jgi:hypothetical protein